MILSIQSVHSNSDLDLGGKLCSTSKSLKQVSQFPPSWDPIMPRRVWTHIKMEPLMLLKHRMINYESLQTWFSTQNSSSWKTPPSEYVAKASIFSSLGFWPWNDTSALSTSVDPHMLNKRKHTCSGLSKATIVITFSPCFQCSCCHGRFATHHW